MADLELLRILPFEVTGPSDEARARAKGRLLRHMGRAPATGRHRLLVAGACPATAGAIGALIGLSSQGGGEAAAARVLRNIATAARTQEAPKPLKHGQFRYTKSVVAFMSGGK